GPLAEAAVRFDHAYALHPRNPDAIKGLDSAAELAIGWAKSSPDRAGALEELKTFRQRTEESHYYDHYAPLDQASARLSPARSSGRVHVRTAGTGRWHRDARKNLRQQLWPRVAPAAVMVELRHSPDFSLRMSCEVTLEQCRRHVHIVRAD